MDSKDEDTVTIEMTISEDKKSFEVKMVSTCEMTEGDIVIAMECWITEELMSGLDWGDLIH